MKSNYNLPDYSEVIIALIAHNPGTMHTNGCTHSDIVYSPESQS